MPPRAKATAKSAAAAAAKPKRFSFKSMPRAESSSSSWKAGRRRSGKKSKASFEIKPAEYQKGDKTGEKSGGMLFLGAPSYGKNDTFRDKLVPVLLAETLRWSMELKKFMAKVYTTKQARKILEAMKEVEGEAHGLPEDIDEEVFVHAKPVSITLIKSMSCQKPDDPGEEVNENYVGVTGNTYPFKEHLKKLGFTFHSNINGHDGVQFWILDKDEADVPALVDLFEEYGFDVDEYDELEENEDDEA